MSESNPAAIRLEADELTLARLACVKLAKILQGTLSIGLGALVTRVPDPKAFFREQFHVMSAFALVLHKIAGIRFSNTTINQFRLISAQIIDGLELLHHELVSIHLATPDNFACIVDSSKTAAAKVFDLLDSYAQGLATDSPDFQEIKTQSLEMFNLYLWETKGVLAEEKAV